MAISKTELANVSSTIQRNIAAERGRHPDGRIPWIQGTIDYGRSERLVDRVLSRIGMFSVFGVDAATSIDSHRLLKLRVATRFQFGDDEKPDYYTDKGFVLAEDSVPEPPNEPDETSVFPRTSIAFGAEQLGKAEVSEIVRIPKDRLCSLPEDEALEFIANETAAAYDALLYNAIVSNADLTHIPDIDGIDQMGRLIGAYTYITRAAQEISIKTNRGAGNVVVVSDSFERLFVKMMWLRGKDQPTSGEYRGIEPAGLIDDGRMALYSSHLSHGPSSDLTALVAYRGSCSGDACAFFVPYIPTLFVEDGEFISIKGINHISVNPLDVRHYCNMFKFKL